MSVGMYSPENFDKHIPANVLGGINRAKTAKRDKYGRFLPKNGELPTPVKHGYAGWLARAKKNSWKIKSNEIISLI